MKDGCTRALASFLSVLIAAGPLSAAAIAERPVIEPVCARPLALPEQPLAAPPTPLSLTPTLPTAPLPPEIGSPQAATPAAPRAPARAPQAPLQALATAPEKILSSGSAAVEQQAKELNRMYDKAKAGAAPVRTQSEPAAQIPAAALKGGRLPRAVVPQSYELKLKIDPAAEGFSGRVAVSARVAQPTKTIVLHSLAQTIEEVVVDGKKIDPAAVRLDPVSETVTIALDRPLKSGAVKIEIAYSAPYNKQMRGLYESKATFEGKEERYAFTHLEPTNARRLMPCFDEPDFKASFSMTVTAPKGLTVLSNMPAKSQTVDGPWQTVAFAPTPKMSTYLNAVAVARLVATTRKIAGTTVTVWTMPQDKGQTAFALDSAANALKRLNAYFGIKYQLPKMDLVAVPDFAAGAMENWGAIFFRDSALLVDPKLGSTRAKRRVAEVVTHEIVHQWFGDLVTMGWWNDLWLNEAFATWMAYKMIAPWQKGWNEWIEFEQRKRDPLAIDALDATRAITSNAVSAAEIQAMFDPLTYSKGGALLRMIEGYLGEDAFRKGIRAYMRRHRYGNTAAADLWRELEKASGQPVTKLAHDWLTKPGYPVVSAELPAGKLKLSQRRFSAAGSGEASAWTIPVVIRYQRKGDKTPRLHRALLTGPETTVELPGTGELLWAYPNADETGFYRVRLSAQLLAGARARARALSPLESMGLLNHLWAQAKNGDGTITDFLETATALAPNAPRPVLEDLSGYLKTIHDGLLTTPEDKAAAARWSQELLGRHWQRLGWKAKKGEDDETRLSRTSVLSALGAVAPTPELKAGVAERLRQYLLRPAELDPALVAPVLSLGARLGIADFSEYRRRMLAASTPEQRDHFLLGLSQFRDPALAREFLAMTLTEDIRAQDAWKPYTYLLANTAVQDEAWSFVKKNWPALRQKLGPRGADRVIAAAAGLQDDKYLGDVGAFFNAPENRVESAQKTLDQTIEAIAFGARFKKSQGPALSNFLRSRNAR